MDKFILTVKSSDTTSKDFGVYRTRMSIGSNMVNTKLNRLMSGIGIREESGMVAPLFQMDIILMVKHFWTLLKRKLLN